MLFPLFVVEGMHEGMHVNVFGHMCVGCMWKRVQAHAEAWGWYIESYPITLPSYSMRQGLLIKSRPRRYGLFS